VGEIASMRAGLGLLGAVCTFVFGDCGASALARPAQIELLGTGWPTGMITYLIDPGPGVTRQAVDAIGEAVEDWNIALALGELPDRRVIRFVLARGSRADVVVHLEVAPGPIVSRVVHRTVTPTGCELASARVELRGELLGRPMRHAGTRNVARHALGHVLGFGHSDDPGSIMRPGGDMEHGFGGNDVAIQECEVSRLWMLHPPIECPLPPLTLCS
jgi:hypothetical protein